MSENDVTLQADPQPIAPVAAPVEHSPAPILSSLPEKIAKDFIEDARKKCLQGDYDGAQDDCLRAIEMNPFYSRAHRQHGMVLYLKNNLDDAEIAWKKAWECDCRR